MTEHNTTPAEVAHATSADTLPNADKPGGHWFVACICGWERSGTYARTNEVAEAVSLRLANLVGEQHEKNPEREVAP